MTDHNIEQEIQANGKTAPRVTPADLEAVIASEHYFTAAQGVAGHDMCAEDADGVTGLTTSSPLHLLTFCVLILKNGFAVTGESACASPENFDKEIGRRVARENAKQKLWPLLGYELKSRLAAQSADFRDRVRQEYAELDERIKKLFAFHTTNAFADLDPAEQHRLGAQYSAMCDYCNVLEERIKNFSNESAA